MSPPAAAGPILAALRQRLKARNLHAFLVPAADAHQSEYIAACDARRSFVSGFTGSAGYAVVTLDKAALWTDGRYFLQAGQQLDAQYWTLMKQGLPDTLEKEDWLNQVLPPRSQVGFDPQLVTVEQVAGMRQALAKHQHTLVPVPSAENPVDQVWGQARPPRPSNPIHPLALQYAGHSHAEKLKELRQFLSDYPTAKKNPDGTVPVGFVVSALDEIAWLFNLRGTDIVYNPVFFAYAIVTMDETVLYVDDKKLDAEVLAHLKQAQVSTRPYHQIYADLKGFSAKYGLDKKDAQDKKKVLLAGPSCNWAVEEALGNKEFLNIVRSPVQEAKAIKNEVELEGFRQCHIRDAAALCNFFGWLEKTMTVEGKKDLSEVDAADVLESYRAKQADFMGLSFDTISSVGANAAIIHYKPEKDTCAKLDVSKIYLCDSGGQYRDGTTDVTRTLHFGTPTAFEKEAFTRVLKGHIALDLAVFPTGTTGYLLDVLARTALWEAGLDYRHGTGHGVGHFLNVHEGPQGVGTRIGFNDTALKPGMTVTNEPGYYHDHHFGIRIENVLLVKEVQTANKFGDRPYLGFEHVTVVPLGKNLLDKSLLTEKEVKWINAYHQECWNKLSMLVDDLGKAWLKKETSPL